MIVLEKNCYKLRSMTITPMKVLKTFLLDAISSSINIPLREKVCKGKQIFMKKNFSKAIMQRSKLRSLFLKSRTEKNRNNYFKQRNLCLTLLRKSKKEFFGNLNEKNLWDNKKYWGVVKPLLSNNVVSNDKIILVEDENILENDKNTAFNICFESIIL